MEILINDATRGQTPSILKQRLVRTAMEYSDDTITVVEASETASEDVSDKSPENLGTRRPMPYVSRQGGE